MTILGKGWKTKVVPLKCSGPWSAGLAAAVMGGTGGHPRLPVWRKARGVGAPRGECLNSEFYRNTSIPDKLAATREKDRRL